MWGSSLEDFALKGPVPYALVLLLDGMFGLRRHPYETNRTLSSLALDAGLTGRAAIWDAQWCGKLVRLFAEPTFRVCIPSG